MTSRCTGVLANEDHIDAPMVSLLNGHSTNFRFGRMAGFGTPSSESEKDKVLPNQTEDAHWQ